MFYGKEVMSTGVPASFQQALDIYKRAYVQYRATGNAAHKLAYETADRWITTYLAGLNQDIANDSARITAFLREYETANPDLTELQARFQTIRTQGPELQDQYATVKRVQKETPDVDTTSYYIKGGLVVALVGLAGVLSR